MADGSGTLPSEPHVWLARETAATASTSASVPIFLNQVFAPMVALGSHLAFLTPLASSSPAFPRFDAVCLDPARRFKCVATHRLRGPRRMNPPGTMFAADKCAVFSGGGNQCGELGLGNHENINVARPIPFFELRVKSAVMQVATGNQFAIFVMDNGEVYGTGNNGHGQLGLGHRNNVLEPTKLCPTLGSKRIVFVVGGTYNDHTAFVTDQGEVYVCGSNHEYQLGLGHQQPVMVPTLLVGLRGHRVVSGAADHHASAYITDRGQLYINGTGHQGEIGLGDNTVQQTPALMRNLMAAGEKAKQVCLSNSHGLVVCESGSVWTFGHNEQGQCGLGHRRTQNTAVPIPSFGPNAAAAPAGTSMVAVKAVCGYYHSMVLTRSGHCFGFGNDGEHVLGFQGRSAGGGSGVYEPTRVDFFTRPSRVVDSDEDVSEPIEVVDIAAGGFHTIWRYGECISTCMFVCAHMCMRVLVSRTHRPRAPYSRVPCTITLSAHLQLLTWCLCVLCHVLLCVFQNQEAWCIHVRSGSAGWIVTR
jgi:alpha-tubulin suppressor-like RCC1 family protein